MKLIYSKENLNGCLRNGLLIPRRAKKLLFGMQYSTRSNDAFFSKKESKNGNYRCQHERNQLNLSKHFLGNFQTEHVCKIEGCAAVFRNHFYGFQLHECNSQTNLYIMAHVI